MNRAHIWLRKTAYRCHLRCTKYRELVGQGCEENRQLHQLHALCSHGAANLSTSNTSAQQHSNCCMESGLMHKVDPIEPLRNTHTRIYKKHRVRNKKAPAVEQRHMERKKEHKQNSELTWGSYCYNCAPALASDASKNGAHQIDWRQDLKQHSERWQGLLQQG